MESYSAVCDEEDVGVLNIAEALKADTVSDSILQRLNVLVEKLADPNRRCKVAQLFLRRGGLSTIIHHLGGTSPTTHSAYPETVQAALAEKAGRVLRQLIDTRDVLWPVMRLHMPPPGIITSLMAVLRAGSLENRCLAGETLAMLSQAQPCSGSVMAAEGVVGLLCSVYNDIQGLPNVDDLARPLARLTLQLGTSHSDAKFDLVDAICGPDILRAFSAMTILQVCQS
jgi:hypothetical protein